MDPGLREMCSLMEIPLPIEENQTDSPGESFSGNTTSHLISSTVVPLEESPGESFSGNNWPHAAVLLLIDSWRLYQERFESPVMKKKQVWEKIAACMRERGYEVTWQACDAKWRSLKFRYKTILDGHQKTGRGRRKWEYFDILDELFAGDPAVRPLSIISSTPGFLSSQPSSSQQEAPQAAPPAIRSAGGPTPPAIRSAGGPTPPAIRSAAQTAPPAIRSAAQTAPPAVRSAAQTVPPAIRSAGGSTPPAIRSAGGSTPPAIRSAGGPTPPAIRSASLSQELVESPDPTTGVVAVVRARAKRPSDQTTEKLNEIIKLQKQTIEIQKERNEILKQFTSALVQMTER